MKIFRLVSGLLLAASALTAQQYTISTVAGIGQVQGWFGDGGPATSGQLGYPTRVAVDSKGNFYIADFYNNVVREVNAQPIPIAATATTAASTLAAGSISTIAGKGTFGFQGDNGLGYQAEITDVHGVAVDGNLTVYLSDTSNARVREVTAAAGDIYTIAGTGAAGYNGDGGLGANAELALPGGLAVDSANNVYVADYGNFTVRKIDTKGNISTIAGTGSPGYSGDGGPANKATIRPYGLAVDPSGNIYISDITYKVIRKITTDGNINTIVTNVTAETLAVDAAGNIYYPNAINHTVVKILPNGTQFAIAGVAGQPGFSGDGGPGTSAQLYQPHGVAVDSSGNVYIADSGNDVIRLLTPQPGTINVVNSASGVGVSIAPGEIVSIFGSGLGPATPVSAQIGINGRFPNQVGGTTVTVGGNNAVVLYTSATQVTAIVPYATAIGDVADVTVSYKGNAYTQTAIPVVAATPAVFTANASGTGQAAAVNQDGTINGPNSPAHMGGFITLYVTGEGLTTPAGIDGQPAKTPLPAPVLQVIATLSGQPTVVSYAGGAPGLVAGLMQVNLQIPANLLQTFTGPSVVPVVISVGYIPTQANVTIFVSQ